MELHVPKDLLYAFEAIDVLDDDTKSLYDIWLKLATEHAVSEGRSRVQVEDVKATRNKAVKLFVESRANEEAA